MEAGSKQAVRRALKLFKKPAAERFRILRAKERRIAAEKATSVARIKRAHRRIRNDPFLDRNGKLLDRGEYLGSEFRPKMIERWDLWRKLEILPGIKEQLKAGWKAYRDSLPCYDRTSVSPLPG
jgi:hypothetical protein